MATQPRFSFDFAELRRPVAELEVLPAAAEDLPPDAQVVVPESRPQWIEPLPCYFGAREPLRVDLARTGPFGSLLLGALAGLFATAGQDAGVEVRRWSAGFAVGRPGFATIGAEPHVVLMPCELTPADLAATAALLRARRADSPWLVLSRRVPRLDTAFGLTSEPFSSFEKGRLWRLAGLDTGELRALAERRTPSLGLGRFSRRCLEMAAGLVRAYREAGR